MSRVMLFSLLHLNFAANLYLWKKGISHCSSDTLLFRVSFFNIEKNITLRLSLIKINKLYMIYKLFSNLISFNFSVPQIIPHLFHTPTFETAENYFVVSFLSFFCCSTSLRKVYLLLFLSSFFLLS